MTCNNTEMISLDIHKNPIINLSDTDFNNMSNTTITTIITTTITTTITINSNKIPIINSHINSQIKSSISSNPDEMSIISVPSISPVSSISSVSSVSSLSNDSIKSNISDISDISNIVDEVNGFDINYFDTPGKPSKFISRSISYYKRKKWAKSWNGMKKPTNTNENQNLVDTTPPYLPKPPNLLNLPNENDLIDSTDSDDSNEFNNSNTNIYNLGHITNLTKDTPFIKYLIDKRINCCNVGASTHIAALIPVSVNSQYCFIHNGKWKGRDR